MIIYHRHYGIACAGCDVGMSPRETVHRVHDSVYHQQCFSCAACGRRIVAGSEFYMTYHNKLVCAQCYSDNSEYNNQPK